MIPRRRQPPLLEVLGEPASPSRGGSPRGPVVHPGGPPAASQNGAAAASAPRPASLIEPRGGGPSGLGSAATPRAGNRSTVILFLIATLIGLFAITWSLAFRMGHKQGQESILSHTDPKDAAAITGQVPSELPPTTSGAVPAPASPEATRRQAAPPSPAVQKDTPKPAPAQPTPPKLAGMPPIAGPDPRKPGFNYLEVCFLTWKDAEPAVRFLQSNGIRATAVPSDGKAVDLSKPQPNNRFLVLVDQPFASGEGFRNSQNERNALLAEIRRLGKKWQTEHRGASDFQEPMWRLQRGK